MLVNEEVVGYQVTIHVNRSSRFLLTLGGIGYKVGILHAS
jgi:hypothetical protein